MRKISVCFFLIFVLFFLIFPMKVKARVENSLPSATQGQIDEALNKVVPLRFLPSHPLYFLISVKETLTRFFQSSSVERANFDFVLSGKRLKESYVLLNNKDLEKASKNLVKYSKTLHKMTEQIEKARSQNQEIIPFIDRAVEGLQAQEVLLYALNEKFSSINNGYNFESNFEGALKSHTQTVLKLNDIKPGIKTRFESIKDEEATSESSLEKVGDDNIFESSPTVKPRKIIF